MKRPNRKASAKERVLAVYPEAFCYAWNPGRTVYRPTAAGNIALGDGKTYALAWADAASRLPKGARNNQRGTR